MGGFGYYEISRIHNVQLSELSFQINKLRGIAVTINLIEERIDQLGEEEVEEKLVDDINRALLIVKSIKASRGSPFEELDELQKRVEELDLKAKLLVQAGKGEENINLHYNAIKKGLTEIQKQELLLATIMNKELRNKATEQNMIEKEGQLSLILFTSLIILFSLVTSFFISRSITHPLNSLKESTIKFGRGNLNEKSKITSKDEVGDLARSFNQMAADLKSEIEKRKKSEEERIQVEKMATVGTLAAGVAHELNNPLMGILNYIQYVKDKLPKKDKKHEILQNAEKEVVRSSNIVKNLLTFSRTSKEGEERFTEKNIEEVVDRVTNLLAYKLKDITLTKKFKKELIAPIQENKFQQVVLNLLGNAIDSLQGSKIKKIVVTGENKGNNIEISIADTGKGVSNELKEKIFDPFFTTKEVGKGTGLGLSICKNIISQHRGSLHLTTKKGKGTTFTIRLPKKQKGEKK